MRNFAEYFNIKGEFLTYVYQRNIHSAPRNAEKARQRGRYHFVWQQRGTG
jgi:hypothetical protein